LDSPWTSSESKLRSDLNPNGRGGRCDHQYSHLRHTTNADALRVWSTTSAASEETKYIARNITLYATVLEVLCDRVEDEDPLFSAKAYALVEELGEQSYQLFYKIRDPLPGGEKDDLTFFEKIKWNFRKSKVEFLVGELDYLKSTVHLLVTVLFAGKRIKSYQLVSHHTHVDFSLTLHVIKRRKKIPKERQEREPDVVSNQCLKAENAILEHLNAVDKLPTLEAEAHRSKTAALEPAPLNEQMASKAVQLVSRQNDVLTKFQHSLVAVRSTSEGQAFVLGNSKELLHDLLAEWTIVYETPNESGDPQSTHPKPDSIQPNAS
jgi:hypothetical protein